MEPFDCLALEARVAPRTARSRCGGRSPRARRSDMTQTCSSAAGERAPRSARQGAVTETTVVPRTMTRRKSQNVSEPVVSSEKSDRWSTRPIAGLPSVTLWMS